LELFDFQQHLSAPVSALVLVDYPTGKKTSAKKEDSVSLFSEEAVQRTRKFWGEKMQLVRVFRHFSPVFAQMLCSNALKRSKKVEKSCVLSRNILRLAGRRESKPCPATKSGNPTFLSRKALGLDRVYPILQRNREKKAFQKREKAECLKNNSGFL